MKLGQKLKTMQILGSKMNEKHVIGNKIKSIAFHHLVDKLDKLDENPKSFLEKR
jgi:hypothetical protein